MGYTALYTRIFYSSWLPLWEPQILVHTFEIYASKKVKKEFYVYTFDLIFLAEMSFFNMHPKIDPHMYLRTGK
jgi:hypothetical protein